MAWPTERQHVDQRRSEVVQLCSPSVGELTSRPRSRDRGQSVVVLRRRVAGRNVEMRKIGQGVLALESSGAKIDDLDDTVLKADILRLGVVDEHASPVEPLELPEHHGSGLDGPCRRL